MARRGDVLENPKTGEKIVFRETAADTKGELLRFDFFVNPGGFAPPRHIHTTLEERVELVSGALRWRLGGKEGSLSPGQSVVLPRGVGHTFWNEGPGQAHFIVDVKPAFDMEALFETIFGLYRDGKTDGRGVPNLLQNAVLSRAYDGFLAGPPIALQKPLIATLATVGRLLGYRARYDKYSGPE